MINTNKKIMGLIHGFEAFKKSPGVVESKLGEIAGFPTLTGVRDEEAFSNKKQELLKRSDVRVKTQTNMGENDRAAMFGLSKGIATGFYSKLGSFVGEIELPNGIAVASISSIPDINGDLIVKAGFYDNKRAWRPISLNSGALEGAAVVLALMALVAERQKEEGSRELIETLIEVLDGKNLEFSPYKLASIPYYELLEDDFLNFGNNADAGILERFEKQDIALVGEPEEVYFGTYETKIFKDTASKAISNTTVDTLFNLCKKICGGVRTKEEIQEKLGWYALEDEESVRNFRVILKTMTTQKRNPHSNKEPFALVLSGASGAGKSTMVSVAAWLAGLDFYSTLGSDQKFSEEDVVAKLVPQVNIKSGEELLSNNVVIHNSEEMMQEVGITYMDIFNAPLMAYETLYGKPYDGDFTPDIEEMCSEVTRQILAKERSLNQQEAEDKNSFMMVLTPIGKALLFGGVVEVQELNMLLNSAESSYLYRILSEKIFALPTGEVFPVHPEASVFFTMNKTPNFVKALPTAFKQRPYGQIDFNPSSAAVIARQVVQSIQSERNVKLDYHQVKAMADFMDKLRPHAEADESFSTRTLTHWVKMSLDGESLYDSCEITVINPAAISDKAKETMIGMLQASPFFSSDIEYEEIENEAL